ncbi:MAG: hypothetical protein QM492_09225 [Rhodobacterales bacterium]
MTEKKWVIDVLSDLRNFARDNRMRKLAEHLDDTIHVAAFEMSKYQGEADGSEPALKKVAGYKPPSYVV